MEDIEKTVAAIRELLKSQRFASLATLSETGIHSTLVAFSPDESLHHIYFCTATSTRKFQNLNRNQQVSLLVHNSANRDEDITGASALTISGTAKILADSERSDAQELLRKKHHHLKEVMNSPEVAYILIEVVQYDLVTNFQDVRTVTVTREEL